jgi:hypothetical protein
MVTSSLNTARESEAKFKVADWGIKSNSGTWLRSTLHGIGLPMVNVLDSTLEWTKMRL